MPAETAEQTTKVDADNSWGIIVAAAILAYTAVHVSHDWLFLACMRDGHAASMCHEWTDTDVRDTDGRGLARVLLDSIAEAEAE